MSYLLCRDLQPQDRVFEGVLCRAATTVNLSTGGEPRPVAAEIVSGTYFAVLGVAPALGRLVEPADDVVPGASPVAIVLMISGPRNSPPIPPFSAARFSSISTP